MGEISNNWMLITELVNDGLIIIMTVIFGQFAVKYDYIFTCNAMARCFVWFLLYLKDGNNYEPYYHSIIFPFFEGVNLLIMDLIKLLQCEKLVVHHFFYTTLSYSELFGHAVSALGFCVFVVLYDHDYILEGESFMITGAIFSNFYLLVLFFLQTIKSMREIHFSIERVKILKNELPDLEEYNEQLYELTTLRHFIWFNLFILVCLHIIYSAAMLIFRITYKYADASNYFKYSIVSRLLCLIGIVIFSLAKPKQHQKRVRDKKSNLKYEEQTPASNVVTEQ